MLLIFIDFAGLGPLVVETGRNLKAVGFVSMTISFSTLSFKKASDGLVTVEVSLSRSTGRINKVVFQLHTYVASKHPPIVVVMQFIFLGIFFLEPNVKLIITGTINRLV